MTSGSPPVGSVCIKSTGEAFAEEGEAAIAGLGLCERDDTDDIINLQSGNWPN